MWPYMCLHVCTLANYPHRLLFLHVRTFLHPHPASLLLQLVTTFTACPFHPSTPPLPSCCSNLQRIAAVTDSDTHPAATQVGASIKSVSGASDLGTHETFASIRRLGKIGQYLGPLLLFLTILAPGSRMSTRNSQAMKTRAALFFLCLCFLSGADAGQEKLCMLSVYLSCVCNTLICTTVVTHACDQSYTPSKFK